MIKKETEKEKQFALPPGAPDPSSLTTQMVWREIQSLKELVLSRIVGIEEAIEIAHNDLVRVPTEVQKAVGGLQSLMETKIDYEAELVETKIGYEIKIKNILNEVVNKNFERVEAHRLEYKADSTLAIKSALEASKELNIQSTTNIILILNKQEMLFTKMIDSLGNTMNLGINNLRESIGDLKTNQSTNQGSSAGKSQLGVWIFAGTSFLFGFIATIVLLIKFLKGS